MLASIRLKTWLAKRLFIASGTWIEAPLTDGLSCSAAARAPGERRKRFDRGAERLDIRVRPAVRQQAVQRRGGGLGDAGNLVGVDHAGVEQQGSAASVGGQLHQRAGVDDGDVGNVAGHAGGELIDVAVAHEW